MIEYFDELDARQQMLVAQADKRIMLLDGAMGTAIQGRNLSPQQFGGPELEGCNENLVLTAPSVIEDIHHSYLKAGCDIIETNTFGSTPLVLEEYGLGEKAYEISKSAAQLARKCSDAMSTSEWPRFVAGSIGPTTKSLSITGGATFDQLVENFEIQADGLLAGGADYLLIETAQDSRNVKAALKAIDRLERKWKRKILTAVSGTIETMGTLLAGQSVEAFVTSLLHRDLLYVGLNCATGPEFMTDHIRTLSRLSPFRVGCVPNAGLPDEDGCYLETPSMMSRTLRHFMEQGWINFLGGCCGTTHHHIHEFAELVKNSKPRSPANTRISSLSGIDFLEVENDSRPWIVGERTNVIGSKKFKNLIADEKFEEAVEVGRAQVKSGAHIIDVCLSNPDRNELDDALRFYEKFVKVIKAPIMIDSTDEKVIEEVLKFCQGKSIINSVNLEDGEERFEKVVPLVHTYGAALVVGTIDEDPNEGMAVTRQRKLAVAERSFNILTSKKYRIAPEDIYFDPLVFPCATGDEKYVGSALETIEGIRLIKARFPNCKTVLGISNVSFGLPAAGREVLNSVFLHHCVEAGLDLAIVNSEKLERFASLPAHEVEAANNLLFNKGSDPIGSFTALFREGRKKSTLDRNSVPLAERLAQNIVEGSKEGLIEDLNLALKNQKPLEIINGPLMKGMDEVGKLFNSNQLIVAEVLQSAEVMKTAVAHLEQFMEKSESSNRGKMLLATVKGDVHDIGKNLVDIILSNNGYKVINLGIKIPPEQLIEAVQVHQPDFIGLSGLLVKSAQQMVTTAEDLSRRGIKIPMLVGGAALSRSFTEKRILPAYLGPVFYAEDAMNGLDLANSIMDQDKRKTMFQENEQIRSRVSQQSDSKDKSGSKPIPVLDVRSSSISEVENPPEPPDLQRHVVRKVPLDQIWKHLNPLMLYTRHLGVKAKSARLFFGAIQDPKIQKQLQLDDPSALEIWREVEAVKALCMQEDLLHPAAVYSFFRANSEGRKLKIQDASGAPLTSFEFPRQSRVPHLSISDYVSPSQKDHVALFVTTAGQGVRLRAEDLKNRGKYLQSHVLQALAIETAEAFAEYLHSFLRAQWGFPDRGTLTAMERFQAKYQGKRYSFGYPACPQLEDQSILFNLLRPQDIGVDLTDGFMMDPEASVSAIVFHHPQATYFSIGAEETERSENNL